MPNDEYSLKISKRMHDNYMKQLEQTANMQYNVLVLNRPKQSGSSGETNYNLNTHRAESIYVDTTVPVGEQVRNSFGFIKYVSDFIFIDHVNSYFHEMRHCQQFSNIRGNALIDNDSALGIDLTLSKIACAYNSHFYMGHYYEMPFEVDADCHSVVDTYHFLQNTYVKNRADENVLNTAVLKYINERCQSPRTPLHYFCNDPYKCLHDAMKDIDNFDRNDMSLCYEKSQNRIRSIEEQRAYGIYNVPSNLADDILSYVLQSDDSSDIVKIINTCKTAKDQIRKIAVLSENAIPNVKDNFPLVKILNCSMRSEFGRSFSKEENELIEKWKKMNVLHTDSRSLTVLFINERQGQNDDLEKE